MGSKQAFGLCLPKTGSRDLWVCMSCLSGGVLPEGSHAGLSDLSRGLSTYEAFALSLVQDWGTEELIAKAVTAQQAEEAASVAAAATPPVESVP